MTKDEIREMIREELGALIATDRYTFQKDIQLFDGRRIHLGNTNGTKIGTATTQKLGFFNTTPVVQAAAISAPASPGGLYAQSDAQSAVNAINSIRTAIKNIGITA
jgi:hypothetical protein